MNELTLRLTNAKRIDYPVVLIDGEPVTLKKDKEHGGIACHYETVKDTVKIEVFRMIDTGGALWFILQLFFFLISVFGFFDMRRREKCLVPCVLFEADLTDTSEINLKCFPPKENTAVLSVDTQCTVRMERNVYAYDKKLKKYFKALSLTKLFLAFATIGIAIALLFIYL